MNKDAYYFPHFSNARTDRKILRLRKELNIEGYGIYFMLLEVLRDAPSFKYPIEDLDLLASEFGTSEQKIRTVVCKYKLFEVDENQCFFSIKMGEYLEPYLRMKEQRKLAGVASAAKRLLNDRSTTVQQSKVKESKESKVKESIDIEVSLDHCIEVALKDNTWVMNNKADIKQLELFKKVLEKRSIYKRHIGDFKQHFSNWKDKEPKELQAEVNQIPNFDKYKK
jgi:hypothetical protein